MSEDELRRPDPAGMNDDAEALIKKARHEVHLAEGRRYYATSHTVPRAKYDGGGHYRVGGRSLTTDEVVEIAVRVALGKPLVKDLADDDDVPARRVKGVRADPSGFDW